MTIPLSAVGNDRIAMGANGGPAFDAHKANLDDLKIEARNWLDGAIAQNAEEAATIELILDMARKAKSAGNTARLAETKPLRDEIDQINTAWADNVTGPADQIIDCCVKALTPLRQREKAAIEAAAAKQAADAAEQRRREVEATRLAAQTGSLEDRERADQEASAAKLAERAAKSTQKAASGSGGLRPVHTAEVTNFDEAARHYWKADRDQFETLVLTLAQRDVRAGKHTIPGVTVHEEKKAV